MPSGTIRKRGEKYYLDIFTGRTVDGKPERIRRKARGNSRGDARTELSEILYNLERGAQPNADNRHFISALRDAWYEHVSLRLKTDKVREAYARQIDDMVAFLTSRGAESVEDVTPEMVEAFQREGQGAGKSHRTLNLALEKFNAALNLAVERGQIASNPLARKVKRLPKKRVKFRRNLKRDEIDALLSLSHEPWRFLWLFLLSTGLRREELCAMQKNWLDFEKNELAVTATEEWSPKTPAGVRRIPLHPELIPGLKAVLASCKGRYVFGSDHGVRMSDGNNILRHFKRTVANVLKQLRGLPYGKRLNKAERQEHGAALQEVADEVKKLDLHALRYTFITDLIGQGVDPKTVQYLAGHEDIETTLAIYAQCLDKNVQTAITKISWLSDATVSAKNVTKTSQNTPKTTAAKKIKKP